jgi:hypothetical protein
MRKEEGSPHELIESRDEAVGAIQEPGTFVARYYLTCLSMRDEGIAVVRSNLLVLKGIKMQIPVKSQVF